MGDLAAEPGLGGTVRLYDVDEEAARANQAVGRTLAGRKGVVGRWEYQAVPSLAQALDGADVVILSILPGPFEAMAIDVHTPEKWGIWQTVGDTVGPGGIMRALRAIPAYQLLGREISRLCPQAWVVNYTNPMTVCTRTLSAVFPGIRAWGCCHEVFGTQELLAEVAAQAFGVAPPPRQEIAVNVLGINHFTWINRASWRGHDLFPVYREFALAHRDTGWKDKHQEQAPAPYFVCNHRVKFDLFLRYGWIAAAGDRHLAEFCPPWYLSEARSAQDWGFDRTPVSWRMADAAAKRERSRRIIAGHEALNLGPSSEEGVAQLKALLGLGTLTTNVNLPNEGQVPNLPAGAIVETNACFRATEIVPTLAGPLADPILALVLPHAVRQEALVKAVIARDRDAVFSIFASDPQVPLGLNHSRGLFDSMLKALAPWLPTDF